VEIAFSFAPFFPTTSLFLLPALATLSLRRRD